MEDDAARIEEDKPKPGRGGLPLELIWNLAERYRQPTPKELPEAAKPAHRRLAQKVAAARLRISQRQEASELAKQESPPHEDSRPATQD
jgi:hypothetical protein